jgi:hypothetical protein
MNPPRVSMAVDATAVQSCMQYSCKIAVQVVRASRLIGFGFACGIMRQTTAITNETHHLPAGRTVLREYELS